MVNQSKDEIRAVLRTLESDRTSSRCEATRQEEAAQTRRFTAMCASTMPPRLEALFQKGGERRCGCNEAGHDAEQSIDSLSKSRFFRFRRMFHRPPPLVRLAPRGATNRVVRPERLLDALVVSGLDVREVLVVLVAG